MKKSKIRTFLIVLIFVLTGIVSFAYTTFYSSAAKQRKRIAEAKNFCKTLTASINKDARFKDIALAVSEKTSERTIEGIPVLGTVKTDKDLLDLKSIIETEKPPMRIFWVVEVNPIKTKKPEQKNSQDSLQSP